MVWPDRKGRVACFHSLLSDVVVPGSWPCQCTRIGALPPGFSVPAALCYNLAFGIEKSVHTGACTSGACR